MSVCRGRLLFGTNFERRSQDSEIIQRLNFADSDGDCDDVDEQPILPFSFDNGQLEVEQGYVTPIKTNQSNFWDSGLGTPTPGSSPYRPSPNGKALGSPIPYSLCRNCDDSHSEIEEEHDEAIPPVPPTPTPPHKKMRALRLYDTPHTPKSLLQRATRRVTRVNKDKLQNAKRSIIDPDGPQANINPFTPINISPAPGMKRSRQASERYLV